MPSLSSVPPSPEEKAEKEAARKAALREKKIQDAAEEIDIHRAAVRLADQWKAEQDFAEFDVLAGDETSAEEEEASEWLIEKLFPQGAGVLLAAGPKTGKTVLGLNFSYCVLTGTLFLNEFEVRKLREDDVILYINMEVVPKEFKTMMDARGITGHRQFKRMHLRGKEQNMNFYNPAIKEKMERIIRDSGATILILDPLGPIFSVMGIKGDTDNDGIRDFYRLFDSLRETTHVREILYIHHAGHATDDNQGRQSIARGGSALAATPDALWNYYHSDTKDPTSPRVLRAGGRYGVEMKATELEYDKESLGLVLNREMEKFARAMEKRAQKKKDADLKKKMEEAETETTGVVNTGKGRRV